MLKTKEWVEYLFIYLFIYAVKENNINICITFIIDNDIYLN